MERAGCRFHRRAKHAAARQRIDQQHEHDRGDQSCCCESRELVHLRERRAGQRLIHAKEPQRRQSPDPCRTDETRRVEGSRGIGRPGGECHKRHEGADDKRRLEQARQRREATRSGHREQNGLDACNRRHHEQGQAETGHKVRRHRAQNACKAFQAAQKEPEQHRGSGMDAGGEQGRVGGQRRELADHNRAGPRRKRPENQRVASVDEHRLPADRGDERHGQEGESQIQRLVEERVDMEDAETALVTDDVLPGELPVEGEQHPRGANNSGEPEERLRKVGPAGGDLVLEEAGNEDPGQRANLRKLPGSSGHSWLDTRVDD